MAGAVSRPTRLGRGTDGESTFVGRARELQVLRTALRDAGSGQGRLVLLVGEPGIGKTRTAEELAAQARVEGAHVLVGRCREGEGAPAFWPWIDAIRTSLREGDPERLRSAVGSGAAELAQVIPDVGALVRDLPAPPALEPEQARFRLFDSLTTFLENLALHQTLVLVLDDLHSADRQSLLMLQFLARHLGDARILVVGTYRDADYARDHPLFEALGELSRERVTQRLVLARLTEADVARYIEALTGTAAPAALVASVHRETEGNPFFMGEALQLLLGDRHAGDPGPRAAWRLRLADGARAVIVRRLRALSADCNAVLAVASVIGREFAIAVLQRVTDVPPDRLLRALDEAAASRVIAEVPGAVGRYRFSHALIREALHDELPLVRRTALHRQIGDTLERAGGGDPGPSVDELAYHFVEAARGGEDADRAVRWARLAGDRAVLQLAHADAAGHYERALQVLEATGSGTATARIELLLALGHALRWSGAVARARETCRRAGELAQAEGSATHLARAALEFALGTEAVVPGPRDAAVAAFLEQALRALGHGHDALRAAVLARLAAERLYEASPDRSASLVREAVALARRSGDTSTLARTLSDAHFVLWWPENLDERLAIASDMVACAEAAGHHELAFRAHVWRLTDVFEHGDMAAVEADFEACGRLAELLKAPFYRAYVEAFRAALALLRGELADAERHALEAASLGMDAQSSVAALVFSGQMFCIRRDQGRLADLEPAMREMPDDGSRRPVHWCARALVYAELGSHDLARESFERVAGRDFAGLRHDNEWLICVVNLSEVCAFLGDVARARHLYELLRPFGGRAFVVGNAFACTGAIDRNLGQLAAVMARWDDAAHHFEAALEMNGRMRARPFLARTQYEYARMLLTRGGAEDAVRAGALLARALETSQDVGMPWLTEKTLAVQGARRGALGVAPAAPERALFVQEGEFWTIGHPGRVFRLRDCLGLHHLARMLRDPEKPFAATQLAAGGSAAPPRDPRRRGPHAERARINVTRAIKAATRKIARHDPSLGRYLDATIRTGAACTYVPDLRFPVSWKV